MLNRYSEAQLNVLNRSNATNSVVDNVLERNLEILGITGVEDRLQDGVKGTLEMLRNAGIKIWMLTGDKVETARCIAVSSKLVGRYQPIITMEKSITILAIILYTCSVFSAGFTRSTGRPSYQT